MLEIVQDIRGMSKGPCRHKQTWWWNEEVVIVVVVVVVVVVIVIKISLSLKFNFCYTPGREHSAETEAQL